MAYLRVRRPATRSCLVLRSLRHLRTAGSAVAVLLLFIGCAKEPSRTDAQLGLNPRQARGRHLFDAYCHQCHYAYISRDLHGPSLQGLFKKKYMTSGTPVNDARVRDVIQLGYAMMPSFGRVLTEQQVDDLLAYLHTL